MSPQRWRAIAIGTAVATVIPASLWSTPHRTVKAPPDDITGEKVTYMNDGLKLEGYLYKPKGKGPFPAIVWNHGSEEDPTPKSAQQFPGIAKVFVPAGYVVMCPVRRGHGGSQGKYIADVVAMEKTLHGADAALQLSVKLLATEQLSDQLAGLNYLKKQDFVQKNRIAVCGCSYGGIQTLLGAENKAAGYQAAVALSPGAESWKGNKYLRARLENAAQRIRIPVLLIHPEHDASTDPGYNLGPIFQKAGKPYGLMVFPPYGSASEQGHCFGGAPGFHIWGPSAVTFVERYDK